MGLSFLLRQHDDSRNEFVNGEAVFYQNGTWEYAELSKTYSDDEMAMIPIYFGVDDENEGLATGTENYWCVNKNASDEDIQATLDFMNWCVTSETGTKSMSEDMGFTIPFETAADQYKRICKTGCRLYRSWSDSCVMELYNNAF